LNVIGARSQPHRPGDSERFFAARPRAAYHAQVQDHHILLARIDPVEHRAQIVKRVGVSDHYQFIPWAHA